MYQHSQPDKAFPALCRYPILRILGMACALAAWAAAAFLTGYPNRFTPLGGFLAGNEQ